MSSGSPREIYTEKRHTTNPQSQDWAISLPFPEAQWATRLELLSLQFLYYLQLLFVLLIYILLPFVVNSLSLLILTVVFPFLFFPKRGWESEMGQGGLLSLLPITQETMTNCLRCLPNSQMYSGSYQSLFLGVRRMCWQMIKDRKKHCSWGTYLLSWYTVAICYSYHILFRNSFLALDIFQNVVSSPST